MFPFLSESSFSNWHLLFVWSKWTGKGYLAIFLSGAKTTKSITKHGDFDFDWRSSRRGKYMIWTQYLKFHLLFIAKRGEKAAKNVCDFSGAHFGNVFDSDQLHEEIVIVKVFILANGPIGSFPKSFGCDLSSKLNFTVVAYGQIVRESYVWRFCWHVSRPSWGL